MSNKILNELEKSISDSLQTLEGKGDIVITTSAKTEVVGTIRSSIREAYEGMYGSECFTTIELEAICSLIFEAINDKKFFDQEKPTLTGLSKDQFEQLGIKIRDLC